MIEASETLACPSCRAPVFSEPVVVRCGLCGVFQHERCSEKGLRCGATRSCKGKVERLAVARVPHAGPTAGEIAVEVGRLLQQAISPLEAKLVESAQAQAEYQRTTEMLVQSVQQRGEELGTQLTASIASVDETLQTVLRLAREIDKRTLYQVRPLSQKQLDESMSVVSDRVAELSTADNELADARLASIRAELVPDLREAVRAIEACRFDVLLSRHPRPWGSEIDDVLAPPAQVEPPREDVS